MDEVGLASGHAQLPHQLAGVGLAVAAWFQNVQLGSEVAHQQHIAIFRVVFSGAWHQLAQHQFASQTVTRGNSGRQPGMVGLQSASGDQRIGALFDGFRHQVFQFAQLVARPAQGGHIVALEKDPGLASQFFWEVAQFHQRRGRRQEIDFWKHDVATCHGPCSTTRWKISCAVKRNM